jgi:hypothetical protein
MEGEIWANPPFWRVFFAPAWAASAPCLPKVPRHACRGSGSFAWQLPVPSIQSGSLSARRGPSNQLRAAAFRGQCLVASACLELAIKTVAFPAILIMERGVCDPQYGPHCRSGEIHGAWQVARLHSGSPPRAPTQNENCCDFPGLCGIVTATPLTQSKHAMPDSDLPSHGAFACRVCRHSP